MGKLGAGVSQENTFGGPDLVPSSADTLGEICVVPEGSHHWQTLLATEAMGRWVGIGGDVVVRGWENDLSIICKLTRITCSLLTSQAAPGEAFSPHE